MSAARVSILIPNFNNGRESTRDGAVSLIDDLLRSLLETLVEDPTPLEILIGDDGSTDDSAETCRTWAARRWPSGPRRGEPFCRLTEWDHCGVLSVVANRLTKASTGTICCRLDGDIVVHTPCWASIIARTFRGGPPDLGVVGPKQLGIDGRVHAAGSWILHPRGHHHEAQGADPALVRESMEVDHVMGCFYCHRRELWARLGGYDETILRGQTVDFGLRARLDGWRAWCVPSVEFTHRHAQRVARATAADSNEGITAALDRFTEKWGFDRLAPDLDEVRRRYAGTPLLWNARVFGPASDWPPRAGAPIAVRESEWARFAGDERLRAEIEARLSVVRSALKLHGRAARRILMVGCGAGLFCHLLALEGLEVVGVDGDPHRIELGRSMVGRQSYPGPAPRLRHQRDRQRLPADDGWADIALVLDVLDHHRNPVGLLAEAHRCLGGSGVVAVVASKRLDPLARGPAAGYRPSELVLQLQASRRFRPAAADPMPAVPGSHVLFGRRLGRPAPPSAAGAEAVPQGAAAPMASTPGGR